MIAFWFTLLAVFAPTTFGAQHGPLPAMRAAGCRAWARLGALHVTGSYTADGLSGAFAETLDTRRGRSVIVVQQGPLTEATGFDGTTAWSRDRSGGSHPLDDAHARALARTNAWLDRRGWCAKRDGTRYRDAGLRVAGTRAYEALSATPKNGAPVTIWIRRDSHLPEITEEQYNEYRRISTYTDWRTVADVAIPFERRDAYPEDDDAQTFLVHDVRAISAAPAAVYAMPSAPHDARFTGGARFARVAYSVESEKPLVNVMLNGAGPFPFVLDTGGHFTLTTATAVKLGLIGQGNTKSFGAGSAATATKFVRVRELRVASALVTNLIGEIVSYDSRRLERGTRPAKAGWLGLEFFERFATTFDPETRTLTLARLDRARPRASGGRLPLTFDDDAPFLNCTIAGVRGPCMLDTGNAGPTILEGHWIARNRLRNAFRDGIPIGDVTIHRADLRIGPIAAPHELVAAFPAARHGSEASTAEAAILSEDLLDRFVMTVDYGRHAVWLRAVPHAVARPFDRSGARVDKQRDGSFLVWHVIPHSAAADAGLREHDRIIAVDGVAARNLSSGDFADASVGAIGATRTYRIARTPTHGEHTVALRLRELLP